MADAAPRKAPNPADRPPAEEEKEERFGPLAVRRLVREDGRALILYTRVEEPDGDGG
jgi:hypothetical protein